MSAYFRKITSETEWEKKVVSQGGFFSSPSFEEMLKAIFPYIRFEHFIYRDKFAVRVARIGGRVTSTPFSDSGDVVALSDSQLSLQLFKEDLKFFFHIVPPLRIHTAQCTVSDMDEAAVFITDSKVSLDSAETMFQSFRKTVRHTLRGAEEDDSSIRKVSDKNSLNEIYTLYLKHARSVANFATPRFLFEKVIESAEHDLFVWEKDGCIHAFSLFVNTSSVSHYMLSASDTVGKKSEAPHKLLWYAMRLYSEQGKKEIYLGPTRKETPLAVFKRGWRGKEYPIVETAESQKKGVVRTSPIRLLWRLVPVFLLPKATKFVGKYLF